jgi:phenylalanine-4-hydroxylase
VRQQNGLSEKEFEHMSLHGLPVSEQEVWSVLFDRQVKAVDRYAYASFAPGLHALGLSEKAKPTLERLNDKLFPLAGWRLYEVPGLIDNETFFARMANREFGTTTWLRKPEQLDYLEEPDMFHDVFGHVPLLTDSYVTGYLEQLAAIAREHRYIEEAVEMLARLYWYTVEFGLVKEKGALKIYGAGILSSVGETAYCMSEEARRVPFNLETVVGTPYIKDKFQEQYFVLDDMRELPLQAGRMREFLKETLKEPLNK